ncbi:MAG: sortase [Chloroflexota bacterium]
MAEKRSAEDMSVEELQELLYRKKHDERRQRLLRLRGEGRVVDVAGLPAPNPTPPPLPRAQATPTGAMTDYVLEVNGSGGDTAVSPATTPKRGINWRWVRDKFLLLVEVTAVVGLVVVLLGLWSTRQELNEELAAVQRAESQRLALPTPTPTPIITVAVLPGGHKPPVEGRSPEPGEVGDIPSHLLPVINAYVPPPIPTPGPEQARRIQIPAIGVDSPIVQGDTWDQLKKGVGQHIGSAQPGQAGNLVLSAHNDIFGEIFRYLDKLSPGDEILITTDVQEYTYIVRAIDTVKPTDVQVMDSTDYPSTTLISCYPYQVNTHRIVVFADLVTDS